MSKNKVIKSVGFNITNEDDMKVLKAVEDKNFSAYVKELILADVPRDYSGPLRITKRTSRGGITYVVPPLPQTAKEV
jgi:hypothetical protein